jgi:hypothetical protein
LESILPHLFPDAIQKAIGPELKSLKRKNVFSVPRLDRSKAFLVSNEMSQAALYEYGLKSKLKSLMR